MFLQSAFKSHPPLFVKHSSISFYFIGEKKFVVDTLDITKLKLKWLPEQENPVPEYPILQAHE